MCFEFIFCKHVMNLRIYFIAIHLACFLCHLNSTVWHKCTLQRLICLKSYYFLKILQIFINVSRSICSQACNNLSFHVKHTVIGTLCFLQLLQFSPQLVCSLGRALQEGIVSVIRGIIVTDKITNVDLFFPTASAEAFPLCKIFHSCTSFFLFCSSPRILKNCYWFNDCSIRYCFFPVNRFGTCF